MGRAELLLVLGALAIFVRFSLIVNNSLLDNSTRVLESEFEITGISLLQETISEVGLKSFDETAVGGIPASVPGGFTSSASLGPEGGETDSTVVFSAAAGWVCITAFLALLKRFGLLPFVIYRLILGSALLVLAF